MGRSFNALKWGAPLALTSALAGCQGGPWPAGYLSDAVDQQSQTEIRQRLGAADATARTLDGGTVWTYQFIRGMPTTAVHECWDYELSFDQQAVLRSWTQEPCLEEIPEPSKK